MPTVSVVMPVYNVEKYIRMSVDSVLAQRYQDFELILVDDGSPDGCPMICDEYADKYECVQVIHKENGGLSSARNIGVKNAKGKYILFVDSDDTIEPDLLEKIVPKAEEIEVDIVVFGIHTIVYQDGQKVSEKFGAHEGSIIVGRDEIEKQYVKLTEQSMWNQVYDKLYLRELLIENHIQANSFYDRVCEDTVFLLDLFPHVRSVRVVEGCYYNYFIRDTQSVVAKFIPERYEKYYGRFLKTKQLMNNMRPEYRDEKFLYELYCIFLIWAYEFMFHKDCKYTLIQRYRYIKKIFSIRQESEAFCKDVVEYIVNQEIYTEASGTTQQVLLNILKNRYFVAWIYHVVALIRRR